MLHDWHVLDGRQVASDGCYGKLRYRITQKYTAPPDTKLMKVVLADPNRVFCVLELEGIGLCCMIGMCWTVAR